MIDREYDLSITQQAEVLRISRGSIYYLPHPVSSVDLAIMRHLDRLHLDFPFAGSRMLRGLLALQGCKIGRRHVKTLMRRMGQRRSIAVRVPRSPNPATRSIRIVARQTVEHPFGTIKSWMGATHFQMKTLKNVGTEMALHVLAYNMKRVISILGVGGLMEAIRA